MERKQEPKEHSREREGTGRCRKKEGENQPRWNVYKNLIWKLIML